LLIQFFKRHSLYFLFQAIALAILFKFTFFKEAGLNDGDSITHYLISLYAWQYPHLFLDNWGKPFFILLSSPFAQFGYQGIQVFNILCAICSAWFCYRIAEKLGIRFAYMAPVFLFMTPVYLVNMPSGLTEILFSLVLIASIYLLLIEKPILAALLISFLPFCRSEGILILPLIGLFLLWKRKFLAIPFLASGFLIYSVIGYFCLHDFLWLAHTNPYHGTDVYGHGTLWFFVEHYMPVFGNLAGILFLLATFYYGGRGYLWVKNRTPMPENNRLQFILLWLPVMIYFIAHSIFWYKGLFGSAGMMRVMAGIAPPYAIICMVGFNWVFSAIQEYRWIQGFISFLIAAVNGIVALVAHILKRVSWLILLFIIIYQPIHYFRMPQRLDARKIAVQNACNWVKEKGLVGRKIYYSEPFTKICLNLDPYEGVKSEELMYVWRGKGFGNDMAKGGIVIWESGLGPKEDAVPLEKLLGDPERFKVLNEFETPHDANKPSEYQVYVFERL
jgi:hypothetical protein